jgi:Cu-Zn family superoxide dismutase
MKRSCLILGAALLAGCQTMPQEELRATAQLLPTKGSKTFGEATFDQAGSKVRAVIFVQGLAPDRQHGLHIHEVGDCGNDAQNAQGHFDPHGKAHGAFGSAQHHAGDLPQLVANKQGRANVQVEVDGITLAPGASSIVGRSLVVHADPDDGKTQPAGNSGRRIACGVIRTH